MVGRVELRGPAFRTEADARGRAARPARAPPEAGGGVCGRGAWRAESGSSRQRAAGAGEHGGGASWGGGLGTGGRLPPQPPCRRAASRWRCKPGPGAWTAEARRGASSWAEARVPGGARPLRAAALRPFSSRVPPGEGRGPRGGPRDDQPRARRYPDRPPGNMGVLRAGLCPGLTQDTVQLLRSRGIKTGDRVRATQLGTARTRRTREGSSPHPCALPRTALQSLGKAGVGPTEPLGRAEPLLGARRPARPHSSVLSRRPPGTACPGVGLSPRFTEEEKPRVGNPAPPFLPINHVCFVFSGGPGFCRPGGCSPEVWLVLQGELSPRYKLGCL